MTNKELKHRILRLDLLQSQSLNQFPNKIFYQYPNIENYSSNFSFDDIRNQIVIEKDSNLNILWFDNSFFENIKSLYNFFGFANDDEFVKHDLETYFFNVNETIEAEEFNPSVFGNGMQIKIAEEYARLFWNGLVE